MSLDTEASERVVGALGAEPGLSADEAASAILTLANDHMYAAVAEITVNEASTRATACWPRAAARRA